MAHRIFSPPPAGNIQYIAVNSLSFGQYSLFPALYTFFAWLLLLLFSTFAKTHFCWKGSRHNIDFLDLLFLALHLSFPNTPPLLPPQAGQFLFLPRFLQSIQSFS